MERRQLEVSGEGYRLGSSTEMRVLTVWVPTSLGVDRMAQGGGLRTPAFEG